MINDAQQQPLGSRGDGLNVQTMDRDWHAHARPRGARYLPPPKASETTLRALLRSGNRADLDQAQLDLLDKGAVGANSDGRSIFFAGDITLASKPAISVIGTRDVSDVGQKRANRFARELVAAGVVVVSGLAAGVDTQALGSALAHGGSVIAVIGTPLERAYPVQNASMQEEIYTNHLLISQFPAGERTYPSSFPARNRTMAAISDASVIIEASETSGTLHQAAECVRLRRWLGISRSVAEDPRLQWPSKFKGYDRCVVLESTEELLARVYGGAV